MQPDNRGQATEDFALATLFEQLGVEPLRGSRSRISDGHAHGRGTP